MKRAKLTDPQAALFPATPEPFNLASEVQGPAVTPAAPVQAPELFPSDETRSYAPTKLDQFNAKDSL